MTAEQLIKKLIHCNSIKISNFHLDQNEMILHLWVKSHKSGARRSD